MGGLLIGAMGANILVSVLAVTPVLYIGDGTNPYLKGKTDYPNGSIAWSDLGYTWLYDIVWLFIIDGVKMLAQRALGEITEGTLDPGGDVLPEDVAILQMDGERQSEMRTRNIMGVL